MKLARLAVLFVAFAAHAQLPPAEDAVRAAHAERLALMVKNDLDGLAPRLAEDLVYVHSGAEVETKAQFLERLRSGALRYRTIEPSDTIVRVYGDVAMVTGRAKVGVTAAGVNRDSDMRYTSAYRKTGDRWQLVSWQSTRIAPAPEPTEHRIVPLRAMTEDVEVVYGDPDKPGEPFVMRIRELPGGVIPPHKHPVDEHITVVQGTLYFAVGETFDKAVMKEMKAGSYAFIPKGSTMFGYTPEAAIVQVHGVGPFHIHWRAGKEWRDFLNTLDSPNAASVFKFKKGQRVSTQRGRGRIRQGYDSGEFVGYEIDGDDGTLFMALESEVEAERQAEP